jgi:hypothetical protein
LVTIKSEFVFKGGNTKKVSPNFFKSWIEKKERLCHPIGAPPEPTEESGKRDPLSIKKDTKIDPF